MACGPAAGHFSTYGATCGPAEVGCELYAANCGPDEPSRFGSDHRMLNRRVTGLDNRRGRSCRGEKLRSLEGAGQHTVDARFAAIAMHCSRPRTFIILGIRIGSVLVTETTDSQKKNLVVPLKNIRPEHENERWNSLLHRQLARFENLDLLVTNQSTVTEVTQRKQSRN